MTKEANIKIGQNQFLATYPNVGQKLQIESLKMFFSNNMYGDLARSQHLTGNLMLDMIDAYAYLMVCCPTLGLKKEDFNNVTPELETTFILAYKTEFFPWYASIEKELANAMLISTESNTDEQQ